MMPGMGGSWHPAQNQYGRSTRPTSQGWGVRPGAPGLDPRFSYGRMPYGEAPRGGYSQGRTPYGGQAQGSSPFGSAGFRPAASGMGNRPGHAGSGFPQSVNGTRTTKDVNNVTDEQSRANAQAADDKKPATDATPEQPQAVEAEVVEPAIEGEVVDPELAAEADAAVAGASVESELVAKAQAEAADWKDKYVRLHAEWDTYRRRMGEQREVEKALANEKMVASLLPVLDDFERTISYAKDNGETGLLGGVEAVYAKLIDTLKKDGVEVLDPAGEPFDALEAQAVAQVPDDSVPDETVAQVYQKGYKMGAKVLRPAMVTVTTGGPKREKKSEDDTE